MSLLKNFSNKFLMIESFPIGSYGCNCSIIYSPLTLEAIIIDPGNDAPTLEAIIEKKKLKVLKYLHTHAHFDHIGASNSLRQRCGGEIHLHKGDQFLYDFLPEQGKLFGVHTEAPGKIDSYIEDQETFGFSATSCAKIQDSKLENFLSTIFTPGHTPGSCSFYSEYFASPLLFSGDTLFQNSIGRTDLPGGDMQKIVGSIKQRLFTLPDETTCIPGHGPLTNLQHEKKNNPFVGQNR